MYIGTGTSITFFSGFFAEVLSIDGPGLSRESIDTTHLLTTDAMTFTPGTLYNPGELTIEMAFDPAEDPPIDEAAEAFTLTFSSGTAWTGSAFMTGFEPSTPLEDKMTATATLKLSGPIQIGGSSI